MIIRLKPECFLDISIYIITTFYLGLVCAFTVSFVIGAGAPVSMSLAFAVPIAILCGTFLAFPCVTLFIKKEDEIWVRYLFQFYKVPIHQCKWKWRYITLPSPYSLSKNRFRFTTFSLYLQDEGTGKSVPLPHLNTQELLEFFHKNFGINPPTKEVFEKNEQQRKNIEKTEYIILYICLLLGLAMVFLVHQG